VFEDEGIAEVAGGASSGGGEVSHGFELELELIVRAALVLIEHEGIGGDTEGRGELPDGFEGRLGGAGLGAVDLHHVEADLLGQGLPSETSRDKAGGRDASREGRDSRTDVPRWPGHY
jgi:hypothetical protein